jgi:hypothetical protein
MRAGPASAVLRAWDYQRRRPRMRGTRACRMSGSGREALAAAEALFPRLSDARVEDAGAAREAGPAPRPPAMGQSSIGFRRQQIE